MSAAARELYISQPAISMAIRQLESKLGKPLLIRSSKGIKTTAEGAVMYEYLSKALDLVNIAEKKFTEMLNLEIGEIKIGAGDTIIAQFLMPYIEKYLENFSNINIKVNNRTTFETINLLKNGQVDIGFVNLPLEDDGSLEIIECISIHDCVVGGSKYAHLQESGIKLEDLSKYQLMLLEQESNSRRFLDKYAAENGITLNPAIELGSSELLLKFASINLGLAVVIREFSQSQIDNASIFEIPIIPAFPSRAIGLIKLRHVALSRAADSFVKNIISLATGSTPVGMYKEIVAKHKKSEVDFKGVTTFNLDEYYPIKNNDNQSYIYFMKENLFNHINIDMKKVNIPNGEAADPLIECAEYEKKIKAAGGIGLQVLGIGQNGHIGFNEPCDVFEAQTHYVTLDESTINANSRFFESKEQVPKHALSMGIKTIMMAKKILLLVTGEVKAEILKKTITGDITPSVPASVLQLHQDVIVVADEAAARFLV
ncbi:glucosamine-6-phosphate isomerase [Holotrichia oblita]|nr:glucosamine-6-phosphate isomerase [Holotrichia oblita]